MTHEKYKYKLFGRFKGRKKNQIISDLVFDKYQIDLNKDLNISNINILDIGSGSGENAINLSENHFDAKIITCEIYKDGNINLINKIIKKKIKNIFLFEGNVMEFLDLIPIKKFFNEIWILFPDPWPKKRHQKRRLINEFFLKKIFCYLKDNGKIIIATDSKQYVQSIELLLNDIKKYYYLENINLEDRDYELLNLPHTKFYEKAKKLNKKSIFFQLKRI